MTHFIIKNLEINLFLLLLLNFSSKIDSDDATKNTNF